MAVAYDVRYMSDQPEKREQNVVDIAAARRKQKTLRSGASGPKGGGKQPPGAPGGGKKILMYVQFILLLGLISYMMTLCRGG